MDRTTLRHPLPGALPFVGAGQVRARRLLAVALVLAASAPARTAAQERPAGAPTPDSGAAYADLAGLLAALPAAERPALDGSDAVWLTTLPLGCLDQLQPAPSNRPYYWIATPRLVHDHDSNRAFWGCGDWSSAVGSTWVVVRLLKDFPGLPLEDLVREKLTSHLGEQNLQGELAFFRDQEEFERPYGYAWLLRLYGELLTWPDSQAAAWAAHVEPLASWMREGLIGYVADLDEPVRNGRPANTALVLGLALDYASSAGDAALRTNVAEAARRFYAAEQDCDVESERGGAGGGRGRGGPTVVSPCLAEAALMSKVLGPVEFGTWLEGFLPPLSSRSFAPLTEPAGEPSDPEDARAALSALGFQRGRAMEAIADGLPADDERRPILRRLAALHAQRALELMRDDATGTSWVPAHALLYVASRP